MSAPICGGRPGFRHRPIHAKRHGFSRFHGILLPCWECPICHLKHLR
jgi:hypothetical protein